ncbi:hypothetical protein ACF0H5_008810 [Mactra antiquata]
MTPESRVRQSINALKSESAWSPMPEHLLFIRTKSVAGRKTKANNLNVKAEVPDTDTNDAPEVIINDNPDNISIVEEKPSLDIPSSLPRTGTEIIHKCEVCGMIFKTEAMLTYHKAAFCFGAPIDENAPVPRGYLQDEATILSVDDINQTIRSEQDVAGDGVLSVADRLTHNEASGPSWCRAKNGDVPPFAVKVDDKNTGPDQTYVCMVQVGDEKLPGTLHPSKKHATCSVNGHVMNIADYDVLVDPKGQLSWRSSPIVGGIPRDTVKGGHDSNSLQYYIARGKAPDGTACCGPYVPQKQQCYFAYDDVEYAANEFHFLCQKYSSKEIAILNKSVKNAPNS